MAIPKILRGVYPELGYILRQAQNEREKELDENSEGLRMTKDDRVVDGQT